MIKIATICGTRPEAIKLAPIILELKRHKEYKLSVCVTAQHRQMLDQVLEVFEITPDVDLNLMKHGQTLTSLTADTLKAVDSYMVEHKPKLIFLQGDTTTVLASAIAAFYNKIKVAHVEAGLRTFNKFAPFPEEINRVLTSRLTDIHFAPTNSSAANLVNEGIPRRNIFVTGNTVIDALFYVRDKVLKNPPVIPQVPNEILRTEKQIVLITGHRRENFGDGFINICSAIAELADTFKNNIFIYPVHLNPNVQDPVNRMLKNKTNILLIEPLSYLQFVYLMTKAKIILTDSGGIQEEAPSLGIPVLVMREETERPEAVEAGCVQIVGTDKQKIIEMVTKLLTDEIYYTKMQMVINPYGDGKAVERIIRILKSLDLND